MTGRSWKKGAPRRVLLTADSIGGVWQYALEVANLCRAADAAVEIVTMGPEPDAAQQAQANALDAHLTHLDVPLDWTAEAGFALSEAVEGIRLVESRFAPDLIHLSGASLAAFDWRVPVVATMHSCLLTWWAAMRGEPLPREWQWYGEATARGLVAAERVIVPSAAYARELEAAYGTLPHLRIVHNGRQAPQVGLSREKERIAVAAGRFWDEAKGLDHLDRASAQMETPLILAGPLEGPLGQKAVVRHARTAGPLSEAELHSLMAESAIFVSASRFEPFGLAVLEAAQRGCALVLSDIETFRELWDGAAIFVSVNDPVELARAVDSLAGRPDELARLGAAAQNRASSYSAERMGRGTLTVYGEAMAAGLGLAAVGG